MNGIDPSIVTIALAAATIAKVLVDLVRATQRIPAWASPLLALVFGVLAAFLLQLAGGTALTVQTAAGSAIAGVLAAGAAVGTTELQKRGKPPTFLTVVGETLVTGETPDPTPADVALDVAPEEAAPADVAPELTASAAAPITIAGPTVIATFSQNVTAGSPAPTVELDPQPLRHGAAAPLYQTIRRRRRGRAPR